ncbi:MAG: hypothetical protein Q9213_004973 [Squamulea squamosa]
MRFGRIRNILGSYAHRTPDIESPPQCKDPLLGTFAIHSNESPDTSYDAYLVARLLAHEASEMAVSFLNDVAKRDTQCDSFAFYTFEALIRSLGQKTDIIHGQDYHNSWCRHLKITVREFLLLLAEDLSSIRQPFSSSVEDLARRDSSFRDIFAWFNSQSCSNTTISCDLPDEHHFLLNQLLIFSPDEHPQHQQATSTCEICYDQDAEQNKLRPGCDHEGGVCLECLRKAITTQMERKRWNQLTCPLCPALLDSNTVERYAPEETVQR